MQKGPAYSSSAATYPEKSAKAQSRNSVSMRSCTWPLRVNISDFPFDCYRNKKVWTRGLLWPSSGLLPPGDGRDASRADTRRPLSPPPLTASHHRSVLTPLLVEATAGRERAAPHAASRHGR